MWGQPYPNFRPGTELETPTFGWRLLKGMDRFAVLNWGRAATLESADDAYDDGYDAQFMSKRYIRKTDFTRLICAQPKRKGDRPVPGENYVSAGVAAMIGAYNQCGRNEARDLRGDARDRTNLRFMI